MSGRKLATMLAAVMLAAVMLGAVACGVSTDDQASRVPDRDVPFGLLDENSGARPSTAGGVDASVFLVKNERLVAAVRRLAPSARPRRVVGALELGPTREEVAAGLRSALPTNAVDGVSVVAGTAIVGLEPSVATLSSGDQLLALAQLVFTLTSRPGIGQVRFTLEGEDAQVPRADGSLVAAPVSRDDYSAVAPLP